MPWKKQLIPLDNFGEIYTEVISILPTGIVSVAPYFSNSQRH